MYDINKIREQFPMLKNKKMQGNKLVYLDNASTTFKPQCVIDAMNKYYLEENANSHRGDYDLLFNMDKKVNECRELVAKFVNSNQNEVVFTSGDTMSLNLIARSYGLKFLHKGDEILLSEAEHASNLLPWYEVSHLTGAVIRFIPLDKDGVLTAENLKKAISDKTKVVSVAQVSNVLGNVVDVREFARISHQNGAILVVDGAQSVPHMVVDFKNDDIDFLTFSGHKMCGPTGIGCLIGKYELLQSMDPYIVGGGMNVTFTKNIEMIPYEAPVKFEAGTLNLSGICGLKAAIEFLMDIGVENIHKHDVELCEYAISKLEKCEDVIIYNKNSKNGIVTFNKKGIFAQDEATLLNSKGIAIRSGQHCAKILNDFLGTPATCRMSTYLYTSKEDIDAFIDAVINGGDILDAYFN
ncbi:MAG: cysteine desulfurase [Bacilli bacterium]|nr:cysteine desulfurase [Bacilli bacterium]